MKKEEIRDAYDGFARWFDLAEWPLDVLGVRRLRRKLLRRAEGRVLEAAVGTGKNLPHYPEHCRVVGLDLSREMLLRARRRAERLGLTPDRAEGPGPGSPGALGAGPGTSGRASVELITRWPRPLRDPAPLVRFVRGDSERLPFPDASFDTVVDSLTLCTYPDPTGALAELARVCRPGGRLLLLEHGRSSSGWIGRWQDRQAERHEETLGCRWNREPLELVREAGLEPVEAERSFFGVFHRIVARP